MFCNVFASDAACLMEMFITMCILGYQDQHGKCYKFRAKQKRLGGRFCLAHILSTKFLANKKAGTYVVASKPLLLISMAILQSLV